MYVYSQKIAKRKASYKRAGACWHYKKSGRNSRQHIGRNKLGRPLTKKRIEPHPSWAIFLHAKNNVPKKEARKFLAP